MTAGAASECSRHEHTAGHSLQVLKLPTDFTEFSERQGRTHRDDHERRQRALAYVHHSMAIKRHNLRLGRRFTMAENRFTDWLEPEFSQLLGFKRYPEATAAVSAVMRGEPDPTGGPRTKFQCAAPDCRSLCLVAALSQTAASS